VLRRSPTLAALASERRAVTRPVSHEPAQPQLYVDDHGDVWLGTTRKDTELSPLLRKCLAYLWNQRHRHVSYEDLQQGLYGESVQERGDPRSSIEKLIRRLRAYLEPGQPSSHHYIDVQAGFGYVLRNFREE
jgi:DNA-binding response OmpR family regulator